MPIINLEKLKAQRAQTFHLSPHRRITTPEQALEFVNERGFVYFWPIKGILLPTPVGGHRR